MDINWLLDFVCLGRTLHFTRAAEERNITQPAFSRRIKSLENWLGVPLVKRSTYPVQLSDAGVQFLPVAAETIAALQDARQSIRAQELGRAAFQRLAVLHTISINYLSGRIAEFERDIPDFKMRVYSDTLPTCCQLLTNGSCDFLLYYRHKTIAPLLDEAQFSRKDLFEELLIPVAEPAAAARHGWNLDAPDGPPIAYLSYDPSTFLGAVVDQAIGARTPPLRLCYMDALAEAIKRRALAGSGVGWLPQCAVEREIAEGALVQVGGRDWCAALTLSLFCSLPSLDKVGKMVWERF